MKRTIKSTAIFLAAAVLIFGAAAWALTSADVVGTWNGNISIAGQDITVVCHFELNEEGSLKGSMDFPSQGAAGILLGDIKIEEAKISFTLDDPNIQGDPRFEGTIDESGKKISGEFSQSGYTGTFSLEKE